MAKSSISEECLDMETPLNENLTAKYKRSFAYKTVHNRLPVIVTQIIDSLSRMKDQITEIYGEESREEIKQIIGYLSKLKNELQTNKPLTPFSSNSIGDVKEWNDFLQNMEMEKGRPLLWYSDPWLHVECYLYRRIKEAFANMSVLQEYDPFRHQKEDAFRSSLQAETFLGEHVLKVCQSDAPLDMKQIIMQFIKISLWGNRCDLSLANVAAQGENPLEMVSKLDDLILINDLPKVWAVLNSAASKSNVIDIVMDNAGYEQFTDLCLAHILVHFKLVDKVRFHGKMIPWFVSDVTDHDFTWLIQEMSTKTNIPCLLKLSEKWREYLKSGCWSFSSHCFWTLPYSYDAMKDIDPELYSILAQSKLVVFKGDLNYRKLTGDVNWPTTEKFSVALRGFEPAPILSLRTIKADVCVGLEKGIAEKIAKIDPDWLETGKYALVSCFNKD